jgi:hypothetical protein
MAIVQIEAGKPVLGKRGLQDPQPARKPRKEPNGLPTGRSDMKSTLTALFLSLAFTTGCSMSHGDPKNPKTNPNPVKRYEVTATADAPGPWDSVKGYISYKVINPNCTPEDKFLGVHALPSTEGQHIEMTRVDENTWKGYFYRDFILDEDYYGLGICHWDATSVGGVFVVRGETFGSSSILEDSLHSGPQTSYFKKSDYGNQALVKYGPQDYSAQDTDVIQHPDAYFRITIAVKEATQ